MDYSGGLFLEAARYRACASRTAHNVETETSWAVTDRPYSAFGVSNAFFTNLLLRSRI